MNYLIVDYLKKNPEMCLSWEVIDLDRGYWLLANRNDKTVQIAYGKTLDDLGKVLYNRINGVQ